MHDGSKLQPVLVDLVKLSKFISFAGWVLVHLNSKVRAQCRNQSFLKIRGTCLDVTVIHNVGNIFFFFFFKSYFTWLLQMKFKEGFRRMDEKEANKLHRHGREEIKLQEEETVMSGSRQRLYFSLVQLNGLKRHQTRSAFKSFNFADGRHVFFIPGTWQFSGYNFPSFMLSNPPVHLHAATLPVVLTLMIPSCLQVTIKPRFICSILRQAVHCIARRKVL